jgi:hypothetical protein
MGPTQHCPKLTVTGLLILLPLLVAIFDGTRVLGDASSKRGRKRLQKSAGSHRGADITDSFSRVIGGRNGVLEKRGDVKGS